MSSDVVELTNISKAYKHIYAVDHINMKIKKGDIYGFIGRNGAGKSTTLKMICGLVSPDSGQIKLFGEERNRMSARRIGSLIETAGLYPGMSAYDNMDIKATAMGLHDTQKIHELLKLVKLDSKSKKPVKKFSLGMKQRLGIAMALLGNPDLLILDEPINGLDPEGIREIREMIQYLNETKKMTIIISSHILGELSKIATRYGMIRDGKLIEEISKEELALKCMDYLSMKVDNIQKAVTLLETKLGMQHYQVHEQNELWIFDDIDSEQVNLILAQNDIAISSMFYQKQDLESYFLERIGGNDHVEYDKSRN